MSYPLIADGKVFVTVASLAGDGSQLIALDAATGNPTWGPIELGGSYSFSASAYEAGRIFAVNGSGLLRAFDASIGTPLWSRQLQGQSSFSAPPTAAGGTVFLSGAGSGGTLYAVSESSGAVLWTGSVMNGDASSPAVDKGTVYVSYACDQAYAFDSRNGQQLWHHAGPCEGGGGSTPAFYRGRVYVRDAGMGNLVLDAASGQEMGSFAGRQMPAFSGSDGLFLKGATLEDVNLVTGAVSWSFAGDGELSSAPITVGDDVYVGSQSGKLFVVDLRTGRLVTSTTLKAPILATDEQNAVQRTGLASGGGALLVPASTWLVAFFAGSDQA